MRAECVVALVLALSLASARGAHAQAPATPPAAPQEEGFDLAAALAAARDNPRLDSARSLSRAAAHDAEVAGRWTNPQLGVAYMRSFGFTTFDPDIGVPQVGVTQFIETAGAPARRRRVAEREREAARMEVDLAQRSVSLSVASAFIRLATATARRTLLRESLARTERLVALVGTRVASGSAPDYERARVALARADAEADLGDAEAEVIAARGALDVAVGPGAARLRGEARMRLREGHQLPALEALIERLDATRIDLRIADAHAQAARLRVDVARAEVLPGFALYGGVLAGQGFGERGQRQVDAMVAITVPLPVLNTGRDAVGAAAARAAAARESAEADRIEARTRVRSAWLEAQRRRAALDAFLQTETEQERLVRETAAAYREGRVSLQALLDAYDAVRDAQLRAVELAGAAREADARLWESVGEVLSSQAGLREERP